jgi:hypothetical protein
MTTLTLAKSLGAVTRKRGTQSTATFHHGYEYFDFRALLLQSGAEFIERFADKLGHSICFVFVDRPLGFHPSGDLKL